MNTVSKLFFAGATLGLISGCAETREVYIPIYPAPTASTEQSQSLPAAQGSASVPSPTSVPAPAPLLAPAFRVVAPAAPPPQEIESIPPAPQPGDYVWMPGQWAWNGMWVWQNGRWTSKPYVTAKWEPGYWEKHGRKYVWIDGQWY